MMPSAIDTEALRESIGDVCKSCLLVRVGRVRRANLPQRRAPSMASKSHTCAGSRWFFHCRLCRWKPRAERANLRTSPATMRIAGLLPAHISKTHHLPHRSVSGSRTQQTPSAIGMARRSITHPAINAESDNSERISAERGNRSVTRHTSAGPDRGSRARNVFSRIGSDVSLASNIPAGKPERARLAFFSISDWLRRQ